MSNGLATRLCALVAVSILSTAGHAVAQSVAAPSNLTAVAASTSSIRLNWVDNQKNPKESGFEIERSPNNSTWTQVGTVGTDVTTFTNTGLSSGALYYYRVRATRNGGVSSYSNVASAATPLPTTTTTSTSIPTTSSSSTTTSTSSTTSTTVSAATLAPPTNLTATPFSATSIKLAWVDHQANPKEDGFNIERSPNGSTGWAIIGSVGTNITNFTNVNLTNGFTYWYRVRAKRGSNVSAASNVAAAAPIPAATTSTSTTSTSSTTSTTRLSTTTTSTSSTTSTSKTTTTAVGSTTSTTLSGGGPALVGYIPSVGTAMGINVTSGVAAVGSTEFGLSTVNVTNPVLPVPMGAADKPFQGQRMARQGTRAVVAGVTDAGLTQLWVVDVTDSTRPRVQGTLATTLSGSPGVFDVALTPNGAYALAAMGNGELWVIDVSVPTAPVRRGTLALGGMGVAVNSTGTYAYVAAGSGGLKIVSLANPAAPAVVGSAVLTGRIYRDVAVIGTVAYLANQQGTLDVFNVATPTAPTGLGATALSGYGMRLVAEGTRVAVITGISTADQLDVIDVTTPASPVRQSTVGLGAPGTVQDLALAGGFSYVAEGSSGIRIYDTRVMTNPPLAGTYEETYLPRNVAVKGMRAVTLGTYLPTNQMRLKVLDVTTVSAPVVRGELPTTVAAAGSTGVVLTPNGTYAVAAMGASGLWVMDVSVPTAPVVRGTVNVGGAALGVALNSTGTYAYVAAGSAGLKIVSLANPAAPALVGSATLSGRIYRDVAVVGTVAYLANQQGTLDVFNVATPTAPTGLGAAALSGYGTRLAAEGTLVTVITEISTASQLDVIDVTNPGSPVRRSTLVLGTPGTGQGVVRSGGQAFVATGSDGLRIYNLANPSSPTLTASGLGVGDANGVAVQNTAAYIADFPATLSIIAW